MGACGEGGVVQRDLQWERELGVTGSSANDKHLCLIPVSVVERPHKGTGKRRKQRESDRLLTGNCGTRFALESPSLYFLCTVLY